MGPTRIGGVGGRGLGKIVLVLAISSCTEMNPLTLINMTGGMQSVTTSPSVESGRTGPIDDRLGTFDSIVLADAETTWRTVRGPQHEDPRMIFFSGLVHSACSTTSSAVGIFYCPGEHKLPLDLFVFDELSQQLGAPGDFARSHVIAHEVGHHVQNLWGTGEKVYRLRQQTSESEGHALSVRMKWQADCYGGIWGSQANREEQLIEPGDFEEGLRAASVIGDDRLQKMSRGHVQPERWTHGPSERRKTWRKRELESGNPRTCDTFSTANL